MRSYKGIAHRWRRARRNFSVGMRSLFIKPEEIVSSKFSKELELRRRLHQAARKSEKLHSPGKESIMYRLGVRLLKQLPEEYRIELDKKKTGDKRNLLGELFNQMHDEAAFEAYAKTLPKDHPYKKLLEQYNLAQQKRHTQKETIKKKNNIMQKSQSGKIDLEAAKFVARIESIDPKRRRHAIPILVEIAQLTREKDFQENPFERFSESEMARRQNIQYTINILTGKLATILKGQKNAQILIQRQTALSYNIERYLNHLSQGQTPAQIREREKQLMKIVRQLVALRRKYSQ